MKDRYDVIVVGAGVNGCGVARDLALRGVDVLLLDKGDISMGTSWASSGMIHGGLRYLLSDVATTQKSCKDSGYIQKIAPHLIFRIPLMLPVLRQQGLKGRINLEGATALFALYDRFQPLKGGKPHVRLSPDEVRKLEPLITGDIIGGVITDEWGIDVPRLCVENALDAKENGADIGSWMEVTGVIRDGATIKGLKYRDTIKGGTYEVSSKVIINCTGPWSPKFAELAGVNIKLRPAKGVHLVLDRRISNIGVTVPAIDGRQVFVIPHENTSLIGTTDDDYFGDLDNVKVLEDEIEYLLNAIELMMPDIRKARIMKVIAGVRPTLYEPEKYEDDLTRDHRINNHRAEDGVSGMISLTGGKLAAYRIMAEETSDLVCKLIGNNKPCTTHTKPLPGGGEQPDPEALAKEYNLDPYAVKKLVFRRGSRTPKVLELLKENPMYSDYVCDCEPIMEAEIRYAIRNEMVRRATDLISRCRLAEGPCQGYGCALRAAIIFGEEKDLTPKEVYSEAMHLLQEKWRWRREVLSDWQLVGEELYRLVHQTVLAPHKHIKHEGGLLMPGRVVVIGKGLAGTTAALAAKEAGAEVVVVAKSYGRTALSSGIINIADSDLKFSDDEGLTLQDNITRMIQQYPHHPYVKIDNPEEVVVDAVNYFLSFAGEHYEQKITSKSVASGYLNELGTESASYLAPKVCYGFEDVSPNNDSVVIVSLNSYPRFKAEFLVGAYSDLLKSKGFKKTVQVSSLPVGQSGKPFHQPAEIAQWMDDDDNFESFIKQTKSLLRSSKIGALLFAPILGFVKNDRVERLTDAYGIPVYEVVAAQASVPGLRLAKMLEDRLVENEIRVRNGEVIGFGCSDDKINSIKIKDGSGNFINIEADAVVLASGKFLGGGVVGKSKSFSESIFNLPLFLGGTIVDEMYIGRLTEEDFAAAQRFARIGIHVDNNGNPIDQDQKVIWQNVFAAGQVIGGFDPFLDGSAEGIDLVTGIRAAKNATEFSE